MDKRTERTKTALRNALLFLMRERSVQEIPVAELCRKAGIERTSFYTHYKSINDIIAEAEQEQLDSFRAIMETGDKFGEELIREVLDQIDRAKAGDIAVLVKAFSKNYIDKMVCIAREYAFTDWQKRMPKATPEEVELALTVMISAALQVVSGEADGYDRKTVIRFINNMINGFVSMYE